MNTALPLDPIGWFALAFSTELPPGAVQSKVVCDRDVVLFRTAAGQPAVLDAHCPHLGAHLGRGHVDGEALTCPFHAFRFDTDGRCISTPYGGKPPPTCIAAAWPVREQNGVILVWHHPTGAPPSFEIPTYALDGWLPPSTHAVSLATHPQETSENSVDLGHFTIVHGYTETQIIDDVTTDGPHLTLHYSMARAGFGLSASSLNRVFFRVHVHGLGFSTVEAHERERDLHIRFWILCTPTRDGLSDLRIATSLAPIADLGRAHPALKILPRRLATRLIQRIVFAEFKKDVSADFAIWTEKVYRPRPALAAGDGPIGRYRRWCRQFYVTPPEEVPPISAHPAEVPPISAPSVPAPG